MHLLSKTNFQNVKKRENLDVPLDILCSRTKFREKKIIFVAYVKKTNFGATNCYLRALFFVFLHSHKKYLSFTKLW
jgi:hypothetical protein